MDHPSVRPSGSVSMFGSVSMSMSGSRRVRDRVRVYLLKGAQPGHLFVFDRARIMKNLRNNSFNRFMINGYLSPRQFAATAYRVRRRILPPDCMH